MFSVVLSKLLALTTLTCKLSPERCMPLLLHSPQSPQHCQYCYHCHVNHLSPLSLPPLEVPLQLRQLSPLLPVSPLHHCLSPTAVITLSQLRIPPLSPLSFNETLTSCSNLRWSSALNWHWIDKTEFDLFRSDFNTFAFLLAWTAK
jgi:hypothetical protein